jgi:hypothetical protein
LVAARAATTRIDDYSNEPFDYMKYT